LKNSKNAQDHGGNTGIREVALRARVSPATVSRVLNGSTTVDTRLAARVRQAILEIGYLPNSQARALGSGRSRVLGLLISEITNPFYPELVQSFEVLAEKNDYEVVLGSVIHSDQHVHRVVRRLIQRRVEGVAVMTFRAETDYLKELLSHKIPLVSIDEAVGGARCLVLDVDYRAGIDQAVQHLALLGHRRIAFIGGQMQHLTNRLRQNEFFAAVRRIGLRENDTPGFEGDHTFESGAEAARHFLSLRQRPTAILSSNDLMAVGVMSVLRERGVSIPQEMSVVGFDDIHLAEFANPPLSSVRMSREALAGAAFEGLMRLTRQSPSPEDSTITIRTQLVVRQSTGPVGPAGKAPRRPPS
jgi:LacI family transcriptional regulator